MTMEEPMSPDTRRKLERLTRLELFLVDMRRLRDLQTDSSVVLRWDQRERTERIVDRLIDELTDSY